jgi:hypothetical protein
LLRIGARGFGALDCGLVDCIERDGGRACNYSGGRFAALASVPHPEGLGTVRRFGLTRV